MCNNDHEEKIKLPKYLVVWNTQGIQGSKIFHKKPHLNYLIEMYIKNIKRNFRRLLQRHPPDGASLQWKAPKKSTNQSKLRTKRNIQNNQEIENARNFREIFPSTPVSQFFLINNTRKKQTWFLRKTFCTLTATWRMKTGVEPLVGNK